jgi:hypothetical protein
VNDSRTPTSHARLKAYDVALTLQGTRKLAGVVLGTPKETSDSMDGDQVFSLTMAGFEVGFRVSHIAAFDLKVCEPDADGCSVINDPALKDFDQIPVKVGARVIGVLERGREAMQRSVRDHMRPLEDSILVSAEEPLTRFLPALKGEPYRLVVMGPEIKGIVTRSDVGKLPVRLMAFTLVTHLELVLADLIRARYADSADWLALLHHKQRRTVEGRWRRRKKENLHIPFLDLTDLDHKITVVGKLLDLPDLGTELKPIVKLRNSLDHAADFVEACNGVNNLLDRLHLLQHWTHELSSEAPGR